jgi:uncharacterized protein YbcI
MRNQQAPAPHLNGRATSPLLEISNALVRVHKEQFGRGPTKALTMMGGDVVVSIFEDGFTAPEARLLEEGDHDEVIRLRNRLHRAATAEMTAAVEGIVGRGVHSHMAATDPEKQMQVEVFVLEPEAPADGSNGRALIPE